MVIRVLGVCLAAALAAVAAEPEKVLWEGTSGGYAIRWTTADLTARKGAAGFSLKPIVQQGFAAYRTAMAGDNAGHCIYQRKFDVISIVGSLVGVRDRYYTSCGQEAHPSIESRLTTFDLSQAGDGAYSSPADEPMLVDSQHPGKIASLPSLFAPDRILAALLADPVLKTQVDTEVKTLPQLIASLDGEVLEMMHPRCNQSAPRDILTRFAIHHVEGSNVAVRLALEPIGGACSSAPADLGLLLPAPEKLRDALRLAAEGKEGFLQSGKRSPGETTIEYSMESKGPGK